MVETLPGERLYSFHGGLRLRHQKRVSCEVPPERLPLSKMLYVPLQQHQGPAGPLLVEPGDDVLKGQPLTGSVDDFQVAVHAPTSGRIIGIRDWPVSWPRGGQAPCIELEPDAAEKWFERTPLDNWEAADPNVIVDHLRRLGLSGLGGAMFPTAAKLRGDWPPAHTLIINGSECEPFISCDEMLMRNRPKSIIRGAQVLARAVGAQKIIIAIEDQMGAVRHAFREALTDCDPENRVNVVRVTTIYPEGGERQLIQVLTGKEVPFDGLPQHLGLVCLNVSTASAAWDAVFEGRPVIERLVTVTGPGITRPRNVYALLGTPVSELVRAAGGFTGEIARLVLGGPLSGVPLASNHVPITKGTNCILALTPENVRPRQPEMPCINCGDCVRVCPASLLPQELFHCIRTDNWAETQALNLSDCIECGCCAYVCPSHIPLVDHYRLGKQELNARGLLVQRARAARVRHEARRRRLEAEQARRADRRRSREQRLAEPAEARDEVQAAIDRARAKKAQKQQQARSRAGKEDEDT